MLIDIFKRLPDDSKTTMVLLETEGGKGEGSERGAKVVEEEILPELEKLAGDEDVDVRFFAQVARRGWSGEGNGNGVGAMET